MKRGDTLSEIARDHKFALRRDRARRALESRLIQPGQMILIPGVDGSVERLPVVDGGRLRRDRLRLGATASAIADANSLANPNLILPGQKVLIPTTRKKSPGSGTSALR